jgi:hypothetical protein
MSTYGVPRRRISPRSVALNLVLALAIAAALFTWFRIANVLTEKAAVTASVSGRPSSFAWGNQVFSSQAQLAAWLRSKGIDSSVWLRRHPDAARILGAQAPPSPVRPPKSTKTVSKAVSKASPKTATKTPHSTAKTSHATASQAPGGAATGPAASSGSTSPVVPILVILALLLGGLTFAPGRVWRLVLRRVPMGLEERIYPAAGAVGILVALSVGFLFN